MFGFISAIISVIGGAISGIFSAAGTAASAIGTAAAAEPLAAAGLGFGGYTAFESASEAEKARSQAASQFRQQQEFASRQAGEYYQLTGQQMELQAQASQIQTLANLITRTRQPAAPQVFTLPAAKEYSAVEQINQAIDKMLRG